uniref:Nucleolar complex protein 2 n=1 Tax=Rhipicephalus appendiculatus TaxID=34631 RepID=A0A131YD15_RHIAP
MAPTKKHKMRKKQLSDVSVEEFMAKGFSSDSDDDHAATASEPNGESGTDRLSGAKPKRLLKRKKQRSDEKLQASSEGKAVPKKPRNVAKEEASPKRDCLADSDSYSDAEGTESSEEESDVDIEKQKEIVRKLKDTDPDFYQYLEEHDKDLLDFYTAEGDEEEEEPEEVPKKKQLLKLEDIDRFERDLQTKPELRKIAEVVDCFKAAVLQAEGDEVGADSKKHTSPFKVEGQIIFNAVVKLCLSDLVPALHKVLRLPEPAVVQDESKSFDPTKSHSWKKASVVVKTYLMNVVKLITAVTEPQLVSVLLRHILFLVPYYVAFPQVAKALLKRLVQLWCEAEESVRVVAFVCLVRTIRGLPRNYHDNVLKHMYMSYVRNCKFTSPTTWPLINFMKRSLVEAYSGDESLAYQHAFLYIRQLAIHLRNAMTVRKKDTCKAVYNWQYIHCCLLWCHLLATVSPSKTLQPLVYPLVQTMVGTIQLIPAAKYVPLRFHLVRGLMQLSSGTGVFIPVMPHLLEACTVVNFGQKHSATSMRPLELSCVLRVSPAQMKESGFRDAVIETFYELVLEYLSSVSHSVAFPELVLPALVYLKEFSKKCKVANYTKKVKQLAEKMEENYRFIENRRTNCNIALGDAQGLDNLEQRWKQEGTPWSRFYEQWSKLRSQRQETAVHGKVLTKLPESESDSDDGRPRRKKKAAKKREDPKQKETVKEKKKKQNAGARKYSEVAVEGDTDIVQDMALSSTSEEEDMTSDGDDFDETD